MGMKEDMVGSIKKEILVQKDFISLNEPIETIYFGGGTPSLLSVEQLASIMDTLHKKFTITKDAEITLEANPDDISTAIVKEWMSLGINRLSLGVQSFQEEELAWMNRAHSAKDSLRSIDEIFEAGISNFSVDLIFGSPFLTDDDLKKNLALLVQKNIAHLSCYALTVEPKTALHHFIASKKMIGIDAEKQADQFLIIMDSLAESGYEHYEISSFAKPGKRSKHNSSYWQGKSYYGFGPSAHSYNGENKRRWNVANNANYIKSLSKNIVDFEEEVLTETEQINEYIMTGLRTKDGIDWRNFNLKFGEKNTQAFLNECEKYFLNGKIIKAGNNLLLSKEGKLFADGIAADLFFTKL